MISIRTKIIAGNAVILLLVLSALATVLFRSVTHNALARMDARLEQFATGFEREIRGNPNESTFADSVDISELRAEGPRNVRFELIGSGGRVLLHTHDWPFAAEREYGFSYLRIDKKKYRFLTTHIESMPKRDFTLLAAAPLDDLEAESRQMLILLTLLLPMAFIATGVLAGFIIKRAFKPLNEIISKAKTISGSSIDATLPLPRTRDEVWRLGTVFNAMLARLEASFKSQKQFAADASHEIRTPLAIVRSEIEYAQRFTGNPEAKESLGIALSEVDHLAKLTESLLMLARIDAGRLSPKKQLTHLNGFVDETLRSVKSLAVGKNIALSFEHHDSLSVLVDPEMLRRALLNIIENAIKFSAPGSTVKVSLEKSLGDHLCANISVRDSGPGIDPLDLQQIFNRFHRATNPQKAASGCGLGLAIARQLVALQDGEIGVESAPGKGATFSIKLSCVNSSSGM